MFRRILILSLCLLIIGFLGLGIVGCQPQPEPVEEPEPPEEVEPVEEPEIREPFHLGITAGRPGDMWYVLSHGLATYINERSEWLTAEVIATAGVADNTRLLVGDVEGRATHLNATMIPGVSVWGEGEYYPLKIAMLAMLNEVWVTLDSNIVTLDDFEGTNVVLARDVPLGYGWIYDNWLKAAGVENYSLLHGGIDARLDALRDGAADVGMLPFDFYFPDEYTLSSSFMELSARGTLYYPNQGNIDENLALVAEACEMDPFIDEHKLPPLGMVAPAEAFGPTQTEPVVFVATPIYWSAGIEVPDDVVYEVTRIIYEAAGNEDFVPYHAMGRGITEDFVIRSFWETEEERLANYHPGALKYYDDIGITLKHFND